MCKNDDEFLLLRVFCGRLIPIEVQEKESSVYDQFVHFRPKKVTDPAKVSSLDGEDDSGNESKDATTAMFSCPEEGRVMSVSEAFKFGTTLTVW